MKDWNWAYAWTYFNETYRNYSSPGLPGIDDIFNAMASKTEVTYDIFRKRIFRRRHNVE